MEKAKKNQNVVSEVEVKEEVEMMNENAVVANEGEKEMMNEEVKVETVRRFCVECGKPMDIPVGSRVTICESCR
jgi:NADH pyrophosphatase NudC (nudix superfamily)